jgi:glycerol-3-phosphate dehydrogenase subunit B
MTAKVVVIGGGLAGAAAAIAAAAAGAEVTLLSRAPGATALYAGGMEITPDVERVMMTEPFHPFTRLYRDHSVLAADLEAVGEDLAQRLTEVGLPCAGHPGLYADIHGAARHADIVPATVRLGELAGLRSRTVAVIEIPGVGDYDAESTAEALVEEHGVIASVARVKVPDLPVLPALGDLFGRPAPKPRSRADILAYPPGFVDLPENGFELLCAPPAPHGWRLHRALEKALAAAGVKCENAEVAGFARTSDRLRAARGREREWEADGFVLATGRFIGGGLAKSRLMHEPLLDLAVYYQGEPIDAAYGVLRHLEYVDSGPAFRTGLLTDGELRPIGVDGTPAFANLRAAGSILGGYDYVGGGCGFGLPLLTGRIAGRLAVA